MEEAFELAERALNAAEVPVGCAFIYKNEVIASGKNEVNASGDATQHAEIVAIKRLERWCEENGQSLEIILPETILHVTVEPCIMCAAALRFSLPAHPKCIIYYSQNERFGGCGSVMNIHTDEAIRPPLTCKSGGSPNRSIELLKKFFNQENLNAPEEKRIKKGQREQDTGVPQKPTRKMITICPLLHYALRSNALECIRVLMQCGALAFQPSYVIEWTVARDGDSKIEIIEKQTIAWLAELILENVIEYSAKVLNQFKQSNVDFTKPLETRVQRINLKNPIPTKTIQYDDVWHCIEKIIEKLCPLEDLNNRKKIMKKLRSGFAMDTLENIIKKRKIEEPKKPTEGEPEKLQDKDV
ncbi:hypothetical protein ACTXT7_010039 [Hymenolepis weldensis]